MHALTSTRNQVAGDRMTRSSLLRRRLGHLRIGLAVNDLPAVGFASEQHRHAVVARRRPGLARDVEADVLELHDVAEVAARMGDDPLDRVGALRELRADPIEALADL